MAALIRQPPARRPGERGFTLLEVFIAGSVLVITLFGLSLLTILAARNARQGTMDAGAALLATRLINEWQARGPAAIQQRITDLGGGTDPVEIQTLARTDSAPEIQQLLRQYAGDVLGDQKNMPSERMITLATVRAQRAPPETDSNPNSYLLRVRVEWTDETRENIEDDPDRGIFKHKFIEQVAYVSTP